MTVLSVIRVFVLTIFFNVLLPSGDVYSDIYLMYQTWTFQNTESLEMFGCKACYGKKEQDLYPSDKGCETCITQNIRGLCEVHLPFMNKFLENENKNDCETEKWRWNVNNNSLEKGECDPKVILFGLNSLYLDHPCCFETKNSIFKIKNKMKSIHFHPRILVDCDNEYLGSASHNELYDTCLIAGNASGVVCSFYYKKFIENIKKKISEGLIYFEEKKLINLTNPNFTGIALEVHLDENNNPLITAVTAKYFLLHNKSISELSATALADIEYLNKDESFGCGLFIKPKHVNIIGDNKGVDCGLSTCKLHLDMIHSTTFEIHDLEKWKTKTDHSVYGFAKVGGKTCQLLRIYAWTMFIPIIINFLMSGVIFYHDVKSGVSNKYEIPFLLLLLYPQWRALKILIRYFTHNNQEELTCELDENEKQVSFIEPFCESGLQVLTALSITFSIEAFYPKDEFGYSKNTLPFSVYSLLLSLFSASFGITKFFVKGPLPILPQNAPLGGVLSINFFILLLLHTMFVSRTFCLEASFFANYRKLSSNAIGGIYPLIPEEYRLIIYLLPGICSLLVNLIRLALSMKPKDFRHFMNFPQFILCPMFSPLMFEGNPDHNGDSEPPIRVWKLGSILNSLFMGCLPQVLLIALDHYRGVTLWDFEAKNKYKIANYKEIPAQDNNALIKHPYGNIIFAIATLLFYLLLTTIFFAWDNIFKKDGFLCTSCKNICPPCHNPCSNSQSNISDPPNNDGGENQEPGYELAIRDPASSDGNPDSNGEKEDSKVSVPVAPISTPNSSVQTSEAPLSILFLPESNEKSSKLHGHEESSSTE